ncbi:MAG: pseudouridine synthase [Eubacteriales bacterium]|nr:pseudouridine synthase [Clostridiales bacterium]MDY5836417.1 pseudouridine synthase [Eubacteriales bacterium]
MTEESMRLNRFLSDAGFCSRREGDRLIEAGRVRVNGQVAILGQKIQPGQDEIQVDGQLVLARSPEEEYVYLALNKPQGITCTSDHRRRDNIIDYLNYPKRVFHIGRLDRDSEGLILLTDDGSIVNKILRAQNRHEKEYLVELDKDYDQDFVRQMQQGVHILGQTTLPTKVKPLSSRCFRLVLRQGLNRQIRRMCEALGYQVVYLQRRRIMNIDLGNLALGHYRELTPKEVRDLKSLLKDSQSDPGPPRY